MDWRRLLVLVLTAILAALGGGTAAYVSGCQGGATPPTSPAPPLDKDEERNPHLAIVKVVMSGGSCSATVVGKRSNHGQYTLVSAAHCVRQVGERVRIIHRNGRTTSASVTAINRRSDISILTTDEYNVKLNWTDLAKATPKAGTEIWHAGYGVDQPGNIERGIVVGGPNPDGMVQYELSVSPGDSGGGICMTSSGELLSPTCCTTRLGGRGSVFGGAPEVIRTMIASPASYTDVMPVPMPAVRSEWLADSKEK